MRKRIWLIAVCLMMSLLIGCGDKAPSKDYSGVIERLQGDIEAIKAECITLETSNAEVRERLALIDAEMEKLKETPPLEVLENENFRALEELYRSLYEKVTELQRQMQTVPEEQGLDDLAYIKTSVGSYSDDADPEAEGISLRISYYDSKSKPITFHDTPVIVEIEIYSTNGELIWFQRGGIFHRMLRVTIFSSELFIEIPYESIVETGAIASYSRKMEITITTPQGKKFRAESAL